MIAQKIRVLLGQRMAEWQQLVMNNREEIAFMCAFLCVKPLALSEKKAGEADI